METKNIIYGTLALAVVGGGAYWFLKNKRLKDSLKLADLQQSTKIASDGTTGSLSTPDKVLDSAPVTNAQAQANQQELIKLTQASSLINQIISLRNTKKSMPTFNFGNMNTYSKDSASVLAFNTGVDNQIANLNEQIKLLGYKENNGLAVKI
jgi:hypothetical protein